MGDRAGVGGALRVWNALLRRDPLTEGRGRVTRDPTLDLLHARGHRRADPWTSVETNRFLIGRGGTAGRADVLPVNVALQPNKPCLFAASVAVLVWVIFPAFVLISLVSVHTLYPI